MIVWNYSIKDLERLSGIKAHTIRMWEQRYGLLVPDRSESNIRSYSDEQLKKLLNISILLNHGHKVSKLAKLSLDEIRAEIIEIEQRSSGEELNNIYVEKLIQYTIDFDEEGFDQLFAHAVLKHGLEHTIISIIYPLLRKIGTLWGIDDIYPAQEHFVSQLIKKKLYVAIDGLFDHSKRNKTSTHTLLFLPQWEQHEIALLLAYYILKKKGEKVVYLGTTVPFDNLKKMATGQSIQKLITLFIQPQNEKLLNDYVKQLSEVFSGKEIYISGVHNEKLNLKGISNVHLLSSPIELMEM